MTGTPKGRKRPRREEEATPPRSLQELEQQDREEQQRVQAGRAFQEQPQGRAATPKSPGTATSSKETAGKMSLKQKGQSSLTDFFKGGQKAETAQRLPQSSEQQAASTSTAGAGTAA